MRGFAAGTCALAGASASAAASYAGCAAAGGAAVSNGAVQDAARALFTYTNATCSYPSARLPLHACYGLAGCKDARTEAVEMEATGSMCL